MDGKKPNFRRNTGNADAIICNCADDSCNVRTVTVFEIDVGGSFAFDEREECTANFQIVCEVWVRPTATVDYCDSHTSTLRILPNLCSTDSGQSPLLCSEWISW
jgi:hypothetical protein